MQSYFKNYFHKDLLSSLVVFLVALPLCMGIAMASGVPVIYGLLSGIIGGLVIGAFTGSPLQVSGPAAGLAVLKQDLCLELFPHQLLRGCLQVLVCLFLQASFT